MQVSGWQSYDPATQVRSETAVRRWTDATGQAYERRALLRLRLTFAHEFDALLAEAGLQEVARYGDFDRSAWTAESRFIIVVARQKDIPDVPEELLARITTQLPRVHLRPGELSFRGAHGVSAVGTLAVGTLLEACPF